MERVPRLTVCVCTHNRPQYLASCLEGLRRQTVPAQELDVIVVDSASHVEADAQNRAITATLPGARLFRLEEPGLCRARNLGAEQAKAEYVAYVDDDAVAAPDWAAAVLRAVHEGGRRPALIGGRILPAWEAPLPAWWPNRLRGILSLVEAEARGEYGSDELPPGLEPCGANVIVHVSTLLELGGFWTRGRCGTSLLSDDEVQVARRMQRAGYSVRHDSRIVVHHCIQAVRLTPRWLLSRLYWQGVSAVLTRRLLGDPCSVWWEMPRRTAVAMLLAPFALLPTQSPVLICARWRLAYTLGFIRAALGWRTAELT